MTSEIEIPADFSVRSQARPARISGWLTVDPGSDFGAIKVPVLLARGGDDGPTLALVGGVHGNEADGIAALYETWQQSAAWSFRGSLLILPVANPPAFKAGRRLTPLDKRDLNRCFPGRGDGAPTERLALALSKLILSNADFLFTLHGWHETGLAWPHVEYDQAPSPVRSAAIRACAGSGFETALATDWPAGLLPKAAWGAGVPAMESEIGGQGACNSDNVSFLLARIGDLMAHLGMRPPIAAGSPGEGAEKRRIVIDAPAGGVFRSCVAIGQTVGAGETLGVISDLLGEVVATIDAPASGAVLVQRTALWTEAGDNLWVLCS